MTPALSIAPIDAAPSGVLLRRIGWLCQSVRAMIVILILWLFIKTGIFWLSDEKIADMARLTLHVDVSGLSATQKILGFTLEAATSWALNFAAYFSIWQLFSGFLRGEIFTVEAALRLRRAGFFVLARAFVLPLWRAADAMMITAHLPARQHLFDLNFLAGDFSNLLTGVIIIALAQVFKAAGEIASENAQII